MRVIAALTGEGLARAWAARRLVLLVWLLHLVLAAVAALPLWRALRSVLGPLPEADVLQTGIRFAALADLAELRPGLLGTVASTVVAVAVLGLLVGAAGNGGVLEVLRGGDARSLGHRFGRGAGRFFGRFVGAGLLLGLGTVIVEALVLFPSAALARSHFRSGWGAGGLAPLGGLGVAGLVFLLALLVLDASRIHIVRSDGGALSGLREGLGLVCRRPLTWAGTWLANVTLVGLAVALFILFRQGVPTDRGLLVLAMVLAQQALMIVRTGLRVALLASESALVERWPPAPRPLVAPPTPQPDSSSPSPVAS